MVFKLVMEGIYQWGRKSLVKEKTNIRGCRGLLHQIGQGERVDKMRGEDSFDFWGVKMSFSDGKQGVNR